MADPVGIPEIASRMGVTRDGVNQWRRRDSKTPFPQPRWTVGGRPAWEWRDVVKWARATDREVPYEVDGGQQ